MSSRSATLLALLLAPLALAQAPAYDPLVVSFEGHLTADGRIVEDVPAPGAVAFPASSPAAPGAPLRFAFEAPVRFAPGAAFGALLVLRADAPVVARDAEGNAFEVNVEPGGAATRVALRDPVLAPGSVVEISALVHASGARYDEGDPVTLVVRPLVPLTDGAMSLVVGGATPSRFDAPDMRVPTPADLRLQDVPHTEFLLEGESFAPPREHAVNDFVVGHDRIAPPAEGAWSPLATYVVLRGEEGDEQAMSHRSPDRERRVEAAHEIRVNGVLARVHPGIGVIVRASSLPLRVECARNCPEGFSWSYAPEPAAPSSDAPSVLVPPPRDTRGIPISADDPEGRTVPAPGAGSVAPLLALAAAARVLVPIRRRRGEKP